MKRRLLSFSLVFLILGISSSTAYAQRGFGGRGFGRGGSGSMKGHSQGARVFVAPQFAPNGFFNNSGARGDFNPFFGTAGIGTFQRIHRGFPIFFPNGRLLLNNIESGLGAGIPPIAMPISVVVTPVLPVRSTFIGFNKHTPITTVINLPPFGLTEPAKLGPERSSRATIVFLPSDIFDADRSAKRQDCISCARSNEGATMQKR